MDTIFTSQVAREFSKSGKIEEWIHLFLQDEGNNIPFSDGLKLEKRFYIGPIKMPLNLFSRCCGPEENMKYKLSFEGFQDRVSRILQRLESGWDMPPLIISFVNNGFELNDGNHRFEALSHFGVSEFDIIIWITKQEDYERFLEVYSSYLE